MKKIHLLAAVLLLGGVSCLHVKRERMDIGNAFSWWPTSNTSQLPVTPTAVQGASTSVTQPQAYLVPDKSTVVVGGRMEKSFDHPADNSVRFVFENEPDATSMYVLEYELFGAAHSAELSSSWNDELSTGASRFAASARWTKQRELIHPGRLQRGENVLRFNRLGATDFYELRNIRLSKKATPHNSVLVSDAKIPVYDSTAVLRIYLAQDAQLWVDGALKELKSGYHVVETKLQKIDGSVKLLANLADGSSQQWELATVGIAGATARQQQAILPAETVQAKPDASWLHEGTYVNLTAKAGSVAEEVTVKIQALRKNDLAPLAPGMINVTAGAAGYRLLPDNIQFTENIRLSLRIDSTLVPQGFSVAHVRTYYFDEEKRSWTMLPQDSLEKSGLWAGAYTDHFTDFINAIIKAPELPGNQAHVPTSFSGLSAANPLEGINQIAPPSANSKGDLNLSFPIELPKGRNGMEPSLQLVYNSSGGNGYFGLGWNMNFPNIQVDTRWGVPRYLSDKESEAYLVNGEQLEEVAHQIDLNANRSTGNTKEFRYRVEGKFDKILRHGNGPLNYTWEVHEKSGRIYYYGKRKSESSVNNSFVLKGTQGIAYWALAEVEDQHGNKIEYNYVNNAASVAQMLIPSNISYSGNGGGWNGYVIEFKTSYSSDIPYLPASGNRPDASVDLRFGFPVLTDNLVEGISIRFNGAHIRSYFLNYKEGAFRKMLLCNILEHVSLGSELDASTYSGIQNVLQASCGSSEDMTFVLNGKQKLHRFKYFDFDLETTSIFGPPTSLGGTTKALQLMNISDNGGNIRQSVDLLDLIKYPFNQVSLQEKGTLSQSRTVTLGGSVGLYAGLGPRVFTKSNSLSGSLGGSMGWSRTTVGFFDINGDGYPDRIYKTPNGYEYQAVMPTGNTFSLNSNEQQLIGLKGIASSNTYQWSWGVQGQALGLFNANYNKSESTTITDQYFADVDADGFIDLVDGPDIWYNRSTANGSGRLFTKPTTTVVYVDNCNFIDQTGQIDPSLGREFVLPGGTNELDIDNKLAAQNTVSVWVAPRQGIITIGSHISMKNPEFIETWQQSYANGVQFRIQHNADELISDSLMFDEFSPSKVHNLSVTVRAGDLIFFRLLSKSNREFDEVDWLRQITYNEVNSFDADGLSNVEFSSENDFLANQDQTLQMPFHGEVEISVDINSSALSEDLVLRIQKNNDPPIENRSFSAGGTINYSFLQDLRVQEGDNLLFELLGNSKVDYTKLQINPIVRYKEVDGSPMPTGSELAEVKIIPILNIKPFGRNFAKSLANTLSAGSYSITSQLNVTGNYTGEVYLTAKVLNNKLGSIRIVYSNGLATFPNGNSFSFNLSSASDVYFDYTFSNPIEAFGIAQHNVYVSGLGSARVAGVYMPYNVSLKKFGTLYRGWGQFVYTGIQGDPIDLNLLNPTLANHVSSLPTQNGEIVLAPGIGTTPATAQAMENTAMGNHLHAFLNNPFFEMLVDPKNNEWYAPGAFGRVGKSSMYNTLRQNELEKKRISNPIPVATSTHNGKAILKKQFQQTVTWGAGAGPSIVRAGGTRSEGTGRILSDFRDMNGDGYPDNMSWEKVQFTNPRGGLFRGGLIDFPSSFNSTSSKSTGTSLGGGPKSWSKEVNTYTLSTEGFVHTQSESESASAGASVGWGDSKEHIGLFDFNGDGLPDLLLDNKRVRLNRGYGFETSKDWNLTINVSESSSLSFGPDGGLSFARKLLVQKAEDSWSFGLSANRSENTTHTLPVDINGDGLLDFLTTSGGSNTDLVLHLNTGLKYEIYNSVGWSGLDYTPKSVTNSIGGNGSGTGGVTGGLFKFGANVSASLNFSFSRDRGTFIDVNNDGYVDYVEDMPLDNNLKVHYNQIGKSNLLQKVETVTGVSMEFNYAPLVTSAKMPKSKWLFTELMVDDQFADDKNGRARYTYGYHNPNYHRFERAFLGFDSVVTNQWNDNRTVLLVQKRERYHNEDIYFTGLKYRESLVDPSSNPMRYWVVKTFTYKHHNVALGTVLANPACGIPFYPALESETTLYTEGSSINDFWTKKSYTRGPKGVIIGFVDIGDQADPNDDYNAVIEYTESNLRYIVGLPTRIRVFAGNSLLREREATYNLNNGNLITMRVLLSGSSGSGLYAVDDFQYDAFGNIVKHICPPNVNGQRYEMTYTYDNVVHTYPVTISDHWSLTNTFTYNFLLGKPLSFTDAYNSTTSYVYNQNGKVQQIIGPKEQNTGIPTIAYSYWDDNPYTYPPPVKTFWAETQHYDPISPPIKTVMFTDGLGQQLQVKKSAFVADNAGNTPNHRWINSGWQEKDNLGRVVKQWYPTTSTVGATNVYHVVTTPDNVAPTVITYDFLNRPLTKTFPDGTTETNVYNLVNPNGVYLMNHLIVDHANNSQQTFKDIGGNAIESVRNLNNITKYAYSPLGELLSTTDPDNYTTSYSYDRAGRLIQRTHPDAGVDVTKYDAAGNIVIRERNRQHLNGTQISYQYDYNRLMSITYPDNLENNVYYEYGQSGAELGRVQRIEDGSGAHEFAYGNMGEVIRKTTTLVDLNDFSYTFSSFWEYDSWGRIKRLVYPDGEEVSYSYDPGGKLIRIKAANGDRYLENVVYDKFENKLREDLGNDTRMEYTYSNDMRRLSNLKAFYQSSTFLDVVYAYDVVGNITSISNRAGAKDNIGGTFTHNYTYDNLYRLASANGSNGSANYQLQMGYSASGNITNKAVNADVNDLNNGLMNISYANQYSYNPTKPHQIANITDQNTNNSFNFEWDENGNMTLHNEMVNGMTKSRRMCWDEENRMLLSADEEQMAGYVYDAGGMRTHKASGTVVYSTVNGYPNSFATVSAFTLYPSELITVSSGMYTKHYYNGSSRIASRIGGGFNRHNDLNNYSPTLDHVSLQNSNDYTNKALQLRNLWSRNASCAGLDQNLEYAYSLELNPFFTNSQPDGERYFYHSDHLGSSAYITTENGYATQFLAYMPYGETLSEQQNSTSYYSPFKFSAKEKDTETGYSYFGARYYSPELSVWLSIDPLSDKYPSLSPYNYCALNPIMLVDPDGRNFELFIDGTEANSAFEQLQSSTNLTLSRDPETGRISASGTPQNDNDAQLLAVINSSDVKVHLNATHQDETSTGRGLRGGAFMGNLIENDGDILSISPFERRSTVSCFQEVNTCDLQAMDDYTSSPGTHILHEVTEAYQGGLISLEMNISAGVGSRSNVIYNRAHGQATPQIAILQGEFIKGTNFFTTYLTGGINGTKVLKTQRVP
jgi:RHS repeat-associated protein